MRDKCIIKKTKATRLLKIYTITAVSAYTTLPPVPFYEVCVDQNPAIDMCACHQYDSVYEADLSS